MTKSTIRLVGVGKVLAGTGGEVGMHRGSKQAIQNNAVVGRGMEWLVSRQGYSLEMQQGSRVHRKGVVSRHVHTVGESHFWLL